MCVINFLNERLLITSLPENNDTSSSRVDENSAFRSSDVQTIRHTGRGYSGYTESDVGPYREVSRTLFDNSSSMDGSAEHKEQQKREQQGKFNVGNEFTQNFLSMRCHIEDAWRGLLRARTFAERHKRYLESSKEYRERHVEDVLGKVPGRPVSKEAYDWFLLLEKQFEFIEQSLAVPYEKILDDAAEQTQQS